MNMDCLVRTIAEGSDGHDPVLVALSGGAESALVAFAASNAVGGRAIAVTVLSDLVAEKEFSRAVEVAERIGIEHHPLLLNILEDKMVRRNGEDRCFACKSAIYRMMKLEYGDDCLILDGTCADDDLTGPVLDAVKEFEVLSPLFKCGMTRNKVDELIAAAGLPEWESSKDSCLARRIPVGIPLTKERLDKIGRMESFFDQVGMKGGKAYHDNLVATVKLTAQQAEILKKNRDKFAALIKEIGLRSYRVEDA